MIVIALDLGGTLIKMGLIADGNIIAHDTIDANAQNGLRPSLALIETHIKQLLTQNSIHLKEVNGVGIGFPGLVDSQKMAVISTNTH